MEGGEDNEREGEGGRGRGGRREGGREGGFWWFEDGEKVSARERERERERTRPEAGMRAWFGVMIGGFCRDRRVLS